MKDDNPVKINTTPGLDFSQSQIKPRLSPSIAHVLLSKSPAHAWQQHRLLGNAPREPTEAMDRGVILEAMLCGLDESKFQILDWDSYRKQEAQRERDAARAAGKIPVLKADWDDYVLTSVMLRKNLIAKGIDLSVGEHQKHVEWVDDGVECHGFIDVWDGETIVDVKVMTDASPKRFLRSFTDLGYHIQAAAYKEGVEATIDGVAGRCSVLYVACEPSPPFCVQVYRPNGVMMAFGSDEWNRAKDIWRRCMATDYWPGYSDEVLDLDPLPWQLGGK